MTRTEELIVDFSSLSASERCIYIEMIPSIDDIKLLKSGLENARSINGLWGAYIDYCDKELVKRIPIIRNNKIDDILR